VRLASRDGALVELRPVRYETPGDRRPVGNEDANWLIIAGDVRTGDGRCWRFENPCLTTWEARSLGAWLRGVASGAVEPAPLEAGADGLMLDFTEPNIAVSLAARAEDDTAIVRVHLSLEALPPWLSSAQLDIFAFFVEIQAAAAEFARAATDWDQELTPFLPL
jgi:hypothetical protein